MLRGFANPLTVNIKGMFASTDLTAMDFGITKANSKVCG